jgi:hypothetical protein
MRPITKRADADKKNEAGSGPFVTIGGSAGPGGSPGIARNGSVRVDESGKKFPRTTPLSLIATASGAIAALLPGTSKLAKTPLVSTKIWLPVWSVNSPAI